ncbi:uncharacterized protein BDZ99DRAFT_576869 [Mytilinidion resinicola]|uniref:DUF6590 domain-containing protein n=1 Tax=Mytilinidion resinicola TaxID=574789 RepID=A0A6A6Y157_9PEZI|nr:uncharacterized protein BDZ99DRAFT_576869 [Mytilinidion resinicola]KAF2802502.1 hypothetical protein BDZ99DRAFT_576869 [Mytilinidion resinicola]
MEMSNMQRFLQGPLSYTPGHLHLDREQQLEEALRQLEEALQHRDQEVNHLRTERDRLLRFGVEPRPIQDAIKGADATQRGARPPLKEMSKPPELAFEFEAVAKPRSYFTKGRFFMVLWFEPEGNGSHVGTRIRRFIVLRSWSHYCICVPVHTYGNRGTAKPGITPGDHAASVLVDGSYTLQDSEEELTKAPIHVVRENLAVSIDPASRINFAKVYTVDYNLRVKNIGRIHPPDLKHFEARFTETFNVSVNIPTVQRSMQETISRIESFMRQHGEASEKQIPINKAFIRKLSTQYQTKTGRCRNSQAQAFLDTNSAVNLITSEFVKVHNMAISEEPNEELCLLDGTRIFVAGCVNLNWSENTLKTLSTKFFVCEGTWPFDLVLGQQCVLKHGLISVKPIPFDVQPHSQVEIQPQGKERDYETLDPSYHVRTNARRFFRKGKVFSTLFSEAMGESSSNQLSLRTNRNVAEVQYGGRVFTQLRRFVVVAERPGFCYACPIFTYSDKGTLTRGCKVSEHCVAYYVGLQEPMLLPGETGIVKQPIGVVPPPGHIEAMNSASRIRFGMVNPVQHNIKAKDLGSVANADLELLVTYYNNELQG